MWGKSHQFGINYGRTASGGTLGSRHWFSLAGMDLSDQAAAWKRQGWGFCLPFHPNICLC